MSPAGPTSPANPYDFVDGLPTGSAFVDRPALLEKVTAVWKVPGRPANLSLFGLSKTGRSSLVARALAGIGPERRRDLAVVWLSVGRQPSVYGLFGAMAEQITTAFPDLPELAALAAPVRDTRDLLKLPGAIAEFFGAVGERGRHVLVVMDDFDRAPRVLPELSAFQLLRTLASEPDYPVGLLTISRRPLAAIETDAAGGSRLDQVMGERVHVGLFTAAEAGRMVDRARRAGLDLSAVLPELLAWSGLHPYLLGVLCRRLVEQHRETGRLDVAAAAEAEAGEFRSYFSRLVEELDEDIAGGGDLLRAVADGATVAPAPGSRRASAAARPRPPAARPRPRPRPPAARPRPPALRPRPSATAWERPRAATRTPCRSPGSCGTSPTSGSSSATAPTCGSSPPPSPATSAIPGCWAGRAAPVPAATAAPRWWWPPSGVRRTAA
ncbi:Cdc6/Cdc18 family protein [Actinacidiphila yeochonensis]|uniref:hypothetical protein n=1 Tax=Actinacidiphila yeochonensis TaxID=89050 RepID=UPI0005671C79|nr:hypothetical protein [Actinacidiphila yeochonensis]